jgi:hypothetical protein
MMGLFRSKFWVWRAFWILLLISFISSCNAVSTLIIPPDPNQKTPNSNLENPPQRILTITPSPALILTSNPTSSASPVITKPSPTRQSQSSATLVPVPGKSIFGSSIVPAISPANGLAQISSAGLQWTRTGIEWKIVEPAPNDRDWSRNAAFEEELLNTVNTGMQSVIILGETPAWAVKPGFQCGVIRDEWISRFASFAYEAVVRYSQPPYNVRYWEIFNEPEVATFLGCWGDPKEPYFGGTAYGKMLSQVYPAMKAANPDAQVLIGGLLLDCDPINPPEDPSRAGQKKDCAPARFIEGILKAGAIDSFDGIAFHSYDYYNGPGMYYNPNWASDRKKNGSSTLAKAAYLRGILQKYKIPNRYLVNTEFALFCGRSDQPDCDGMIASVETTKAYYIVQFAAMAVADGYKSAIWYASMGGRNNGLINNDLTSKPVLIAYQFASDMIGNATFTQKVDLDPAFQIYEFKNNEKKIWVVWTFDGQKHTLKIPSMPAELYRIQSDGQASSERPAQSVEMSLEPMFLVFK